MASECLHDQPKLSSLATTASHEKVDRIVPQIVNIVSQDAELRDIAVREPTLDEIFLQLRRTNNRPLMSRSTISIWTSPTISGARSPMRSRSFTRHRGAAVR